MSLCYDSHYTRQNDTIHTHNTNYKTQHMTYLHNDKVRKYANGQVQIANDKVQVAINKLQVAKYKMQVATCQ